MCVIQQRANSFFSLSFQVFRLDALGCKPLLLYATREDNKLKAHAIYEERTFARTELLDKIEKA